MGMRLITLLVCFFVKIAKIRSLNETSCMAINGTFVYHHSSCIVLYNTPTTWAQARTNCRYENNLKILTTLDTKYSRLAIPQDNDTFELIRDYVQPLTTTPVPQEMWIGLFWNNLGVARQI